MLFHVPEVATAVDFSTRITRPLLGGGARNLRIFMIWEKPEAHSRQGMLDAPIPSRAGSGSPRRRIETHGFEFGEDVADEDVDLGAQREAVGVVREPDFPGAEL